MSTLMSLVIEMYSRQAVLNLDHNVFMSASFCRHEVCLFGDFISLGKAGKETFFRGLDIMILEARRVPGCEVLED